MLKGLLCGMDINSKLPQDISSVQSLMLIYHDKYKSYNYKSYKNTYGMNNEILNYDSSFAHIIFCRLSNAFAVVRIEFIKC